MGEEKRKEKYVLGLYKVFIQRSPLGPGVDHVQRVSDTALQHCCNLVAWNRFKFLL